MAGILFGKRYPGTQIGQIELDATVEENHNFQSTVTAFPIETGATISDHIYNQPITLSLSGIVSDTPLNAFFQPALDLINNVRGFSSLFSNTNANNLTRSQSVFDELYRIYQKRELVRVITGLKQYNNMAITAISCPRNAGTGQALRFQINFVQVDFVSSSPFDRAQDIFIQTPTGVITKDQIANNSQYPILELDPVDSLKDQAQSASDVGRQQTQPINDSRTAIINDVRAGLQ